MEAVSAQAGAVQKQEAAARFGVENGQEVRLQAFTARPVVFEGVEVRISPKFATAVHIDYDEANACGYEKGVSCRIVR